jgi:hypothetical protein
MYPWKWNHASSRVEFYVTTDGQSASLSWNKAPIWGLRPDLYYCQTVADSLMWGALSDERRVCRLQLLLALTSAVILGSESHGTRGHILLSQIRDFPFRHLLRLAGLRWRYSTPPPHETLLNQPLFFRKECQLWIDLTFDNRLQKPTAEMKPARWIAWLQVVDYCCLIWSKLQQLCCPSCTRLRHSSRLS